MNYKSLFSEICLQSESLSVKDSCVFYKTVSLATLFTTQDSFHSATRNKQGQGYVLFKDGL